MYFFFFRRSFFAACLLPICLIGLQLDLSGATDSVLDQDAPAYKASVSKVVLDFLKALSEGKTDTVQNTVTNEYWTAGQKFISNVDPKQSVSEAIAADFNTYNIIGVNRVIVDKNIAFVEVKISYKKEQLDDIRQEEQDNIQSKTTGTLWQGFGGSSSDSPFESGGVGLATYYLVLQSGLWKIHFTYFSINPMTESQLVSASKELSKLFVPLPGK